jgi:LysM repeat protein
MKKNANKREFDPNQVLVRDLHRQKITNTQNASIKSKVDKILNDNTDSDTTFPPDKGKEVDVRHIVNANAYYNKGKELYDASKTLKAEEALNEANKIIPTVEALEEKKGHYIAYGFQSEMNKLAKAAQIQTIVKQVTNALSNARGQKEVEVIMNKTERMMRKLPRKTQEKLTEAMQKVLGKKIKGGPLVSKGELRAMAKEPGYNRKYVGSAKDSTGGRWGHTAVSPKESKTVRGRYKNIVNQSYSKQKIQNEGLAATKKKKRIYTPFKKKASQIMQKLAEPTTEEGNYVIKSGDTLTDIAARYNTTVSNILAKNQYPGPGIQSLGTLNPGKTISIPTTEIKNNE